MCKKTRLLIVIFSAFVVIASACGESVEISSTQTKSQRIKKEPLQTDSQPTSYKSPLNFDGYEFGSLINEAFQLQYSWENNAKYEYIIKQLHLNRKTVFNILRERYLSLDPTDVYLIPVRERILGVITHLDEEQSIPFFKKIVADPLPSESINLNQEDHHWSNVEDESALRIFAVSSLGRFVANGITSMEVLSQTFILQEDRGIRYALAIEMVLQGASRNSVTDFANSQGAHWIGEVFSRPAPIIYDDDSLKLPIDHKPDEDEQTEDDLYPIPEVK